MLTGCDTLPVAAEYLHRTAFDTAAAYGKDMFLAIERLGTNRLPALLAVKARVDALAAPGVLRAGLADRFSPHRAILPPHLPERLRAFRDRFEHHLILTVPGDGKEARALLQALFPSASATGSTALRRKRARPCSTASSLPGRRSATATCTATLSRTSSPSTSLLPQRPRLVRAARRRGRGGAGPQDLLRSLLLPRLPPGLCRRKGPRRRGDQAADARTAPEARRGISRRA